ncbi:T9SS type A sorting domain-containing protein [Rubrivirga marina]|uniref:Secretion system C-terminal sorting domain-containing protein n=1 Tax=Rubrivirga marina TaxID=1196024 RepID=A0A271IXW2_9BACT|nr:T9SS type A sorting domain-containing protein [Rubrivirga marina]PAP75970.1 hypothetical protein BSZ37_05705 [Rubrivirga marina]
MPWAISHQTSDPIGADTSRTAPPDRGRLRLHALLPPCVARSSAPSRSPSSLPPPPSAPSDITASGVVGSWWEGTLSTIQFYDPATGHWAAPNGTGTFLILRTDGTFRAGGILNVTAGVCTSTIMVDEHGRYATSADSLVLDRQRGNSRVTNTCWSDADGRSARRPLARSPPAPNLAHGRAEVEMAGTGPVRVEVFDTLGRRVATLHEGPVVRRRRALAVDTAGLPAGAYIIRATGTDGVASRPLTVVR